jgi:hypothetical protein
MLAFSGDAGKSGSESDAKGRFSPIMLPARADCHKRFYIPSESLLLLAVPKWFSSLFTPIPSALHPSARHEFTYDF